MRALRDAACARSVRSGFMRILHLAMQEEHLLELQAGRYKGVEKQAVLALGIRTAGF